MFTGIVAHMGQVSAVSEIPEGQRFVIAGDGLGALPIGASLAVNGVCLTAVETAEDSVVVEVIPETLQRSNLAAVGPGDQVNLELPMLADGRFDGHIVQGHVDGVGIVAEVTRDSGGGVMMTIDSPDPLRRYIVEKGSVAIDGVSLTVADLTDHGFRVALIPHTLAVTTLGLRKPGDMVNLEMDVVAKYVERLLKANP